jgi:hypothetical protein
MVIECGARKERIRERSGIYSAGEGPVGHPWGEHVVVQKVRRPTQCTHREHVVSNLAASYLVQMEKRVSSCPAANQSTVTMGKQMSRGQLSRSPRAPIPALEPRTIGLLQRHPFRRRL